MTNILHISAGVRETDSHSRRYGNRILARIRALCPEASMTRRDLCRPFLPHPTDAFVLASLLSENERGAEDHEALVLSEQLIDEVEKADAVVIDLPMHNFTIPSTLKAWVDYIVRPQRTFANSPNGKVGLLADRPTFCVMTCGGPVGADNRSQPDFGRPYLLHVLTTIGIRSVEFFIADNLRRGDLAVQHTDETFASWLSALSSRVFQSQG